jgi:cell cycle sensor histidine kinase DivJ
MPSLKQMGKSLRRKGSSQQGDPQASCSKPLENVISSELILNNSPTYVCSLNNRGDWLPVAPGNCDYFKSIKTDNFAQWVNQAVHVQDRFAVLKAVNDCRTDECDTSVDFRVLNDLKKSGAPQWLEIKCAAVSTHQEILTFLRDISDLKLFEKKLLEERAGAQAANIAKSRFLANMSHELRTPLNAIIGFSEILKSGMIGASEVKKQQEYQSLIHDSARHLLSVLNDVLDMSKIEAGKFEIFPENIDLKQIVVSCCSILLPLANKADVKLCVVDPNEPIRLEADPKAILQILFNLTSNAIKFAKPGTNIDISASRIGRKVIIKIRDQGRGISSEYLDLLGEPFQQIECHKNRHCEGTGLGLSIVKGLVQLHGGNFDIESVIDVGTTVTIGFVQSRGLSRPVPAHDSDTILKVNPNSADSRQSRSVISRLAG